MNITNPKHIKWVAALLVTSAIAIAGLKVGESKAQSFTPLTGSCGMLYTNNFAGFESVKLAQNGVVSNQLILVNFSTGLASYVRATIDDYGQLPSLTAVPGTFNFTQSAGDIPNSVKLTITNGGSAYITVLPVNSGNTFLVQLAAGGNGSAPGSGVCQKV